MTRKKAIAKKNILPKYNEAMTVGVIMVLISSVCFGLQGVAVKLTYQSQVGIMAIMVWRKVMFLPVFWAIMLYKYPYQKIFGKKRYIMFSMIIGAVGYYIVPMISFHALEIIGAGIERMVLYTFPAFVIIFNALIERRLPPLKHVIAFVVVQFGIFLLMGGASGLAILQANLAGTYLMIIDALIMGFYVIATQQVMRHISSLVFMLWAVTGATTVIMLHTVLDWQHIHLAENNIGFMMIFLTMMVSFPPAILFAEGIKRIGGSRAALINSSAPMLTLVFAYFLLGEILLPMQLMGAFIIMAALFILEGRAMGTFIKRRRLINKG